MSYQTPNLNLSLIAPNQAQRYITYNEAISRLDSLVQLSALSRTKSFALNDIAEGERFIVPSVRRHIIWHRFWARLRETLLIMLVDIKRRLCGIASVGVR